MKCKDCQQELSPMDQMILQMANTLVEGVPNQCTECREKEIVDRFPCGRCGAKMQAREIMAAQFANMMVGSDFPVLCENCRTIIMSEIPQEVKDIARKEIPNCNNPACPVHGRIH